MQLYSITTLQQELPYLAGDLLEAPLVDVGEWHAMDVKGNPALVSREIQDTVFSFHVPPGILDWQHACGPNLPWAEEHFTERVLNSDPQNPPPSSERWPFATGSNAGNDRHKKDGQFSHSYVERFWPKMANTGGTISWSKRQVFVPHVGIRFEYGDFNDLIQVLQDNPMTRQAYLPIWFPEDLNAAVMDERVPCTLGYHFMVRPVGDRLRMNCNYYLRSCDFMRYFVDDVYMAGRLLQFLCLTQLGRDDIVPGQLNVHISSLHAFVGDEPKLKEMRDGR